MTCRIVLLGVLAVTFVAMPILVDAKKKDSELFQGTWLITALVVNGNVEDAKTKLRGMKIVFSGNKMALAGPEGNQKEFTFTVDSSKSPKAIDTTALDGPHKGQTNPGIYKLDGDALLLCLPNDKVMERPKEFASPVGAKLVLLTLTKEKK